MRIRHRIAILAALAIGAPALAAVAPVAALPAIVAPAPAAAANCYADAGGTTNVAGALRYFFNLGSCTGVSKVRFVWQVPNVGTTGWFDGTWQGFTWAYVGQLGNTTSIEKPISGEGGGAQIQVTQYCYWHGPPPNGSQHVLQPHVYFQIFNKVTATWGQPAEYLDESVTYPFCA